MAQMRGADILARALAAAGVRHLFSLSGNQIMPLYDAALDARLSIVHVRHEGAAVHMADAWGRLTGEPGVALLTGGPGHANGIGALYTALAAESPMVLLSGHAPLAELGRGAFQEMRQADLAAPVTKDSWTAGSAATLGEDIERALRIGLTALQDVGVTVNVDVVRSEFEKLVRQTEFVNERAASALEQTLRANFADGEGRLPRTLEAFLGDRGALRTFVNDLFDESKRDSAIGRIGSLLGTYFDGDASKLALLLDPTRLGSPMHQFREEIAAGFQQLNERLVAIEAAATARATERAKSAAKGADFEDLLDAMLADVARGAGDIVDRTSDEQGDVIRSKKGDFVITVNPGLSNGVDLKVVVEAKDRVISGRLMRDELREAKTNRGAAVGLVVFTPLHAPSGIAPFDVRAGDVYCVIDPEAPEPATLEAAVRLARLLALAGLRETEVEVDAAAIGVFHPRS